MIKFSRVVSVVGLLQCSFANAVPNVWTSGVQIGTYGNVITNQGNNTLYLSCDVGGNWGNDVMFHNYDPNDNLKFRLATDINGYASIEDENNALSFLINNELVLTKYEFSKDYKNFFDKIASAKNIKVYNYNKLIGAFTPTQKSRILNAKRIKTECLNEL